MRPEEICIGDWFRYRFKNSYGNEIVLTFQVSRIDPSFGSYCVWSEEHGRVCYIESLEPVELTPEILEKNGFSGEGYNMGIVGFSKGPIPELKDGYEVFIWRDNYLQIDHGFTHFKKYIKYIHELQHALWFCGIEKEIVL